MINARLVLLGLLSLAGGVLHAQNVAEDVLKGKEIQGIVFKSYVGPHAVIETRAAIQGIGADLGRQIKTSGAEADYAKKYHVIRVHDATASKLSADIFILAPNAGVDDIRNLNWIVSAYLQQAFGYSPTDADLLADFVTRYNAFYRGKMDYIAATFIPAVGTNVTAENAGIALDYAEWPGKTRLLIPLRDSLSKGLSGSVNTEEISNKDITTKMATEPGAGVDERKKLADLKEGEIVQEQKAVAQAEAKIAAPAAGTPPGPTATTSPAPSVSPQPATPAPAAAASTPAPAATPAPSAAPAATPAPAMPLDKAKQDLATRDQALQNERKDIVKTEQAQPAATPTPAPAAAPATTPFVVMNESSKLGQVWLIDTAANKVWKKSDLNSVRQPSAPVFGAGLLVVAGDAKAATGAIRLVLLSKDDASVKATGTDDVSPDTPVLIVGNMVYALTKADKGGWVLGAFDANLKAAAKGTDTLSALTGLTQTSTGLMVQASGGQVLILDPQTLKKKAGAN